MDYSKAFSAHPPRGLNGHYILQSVGYKEVFHKRKIWAVFGYSKMYYKPYSYIRKLVVLLNAFILVDKFQFFFAITENWSITNNDPQLGKPQIRFCKRKNS